MNKELIAGGVRKPYIKVATSYLPANKNPVLKDWVFIRGKENFSLSSDSQWEVTILSCGHFAVSRGDGLTQREGCHFHHIETGDATVQGGTPRNSK